MSTLKKSGDEKVKELQKTIDAMKEEETRVKTNMVSNIPEVGTFVKLISSELKTFEYDILNPDLLINLEINKMKRTSNI